MAGPEVVESRNKSGDRGRTRSPAERASRQSPRHSTTRFTACCVPMLRLAERRPSYRHDVCHVVERDALLECQALHIFDGKFPMAGKKKAAKPELIEAGTDKRFVRRDDEGKFKESDDVGRSLAQNARKKAKTKTKPGQGDKGDHDA